MPMKVMMEKEKKIDERPWKKKHYLVTWTLNRDSLSLQLTLLLLIVLSNIMS